MSNWIKVGVVLVALIGVGLICLASRAGAQNYGSRMESSLKAAYTDSKNVYAQFTQAVAEVAQVPAMYRDDLEKIVKAAIEGRYGAEGSKATFQFLQEQNPTLDPGMYVKIQQIIEAGRSNFENAQRRVIDIRRQYETNLGYFWRGFWLRQAGYPKVNLSDFDIVSTEKADQVFKDKKETSPLQIRPSAPSDVEVK